MRVRLTEIRWRRVCSAGLLVLGWSAFGGVVSGPGYGAQTADNRDPSTSLSAPVNGATVSGTVPVWASASDNVGVTKVEILVDGTVAGTDSTAPYTWGWLSGTVADGSHTLQTRAYDAAGNVGLSAVVTVTVANGGGGSGDGQAPSTSLGAPVSGATVSGTVPVWASASDNVGVTNVEILIDGKVEGTDSTAPYTWGWLSGTVGDGSHTLQTRAYDAAGNVGLSAVVTVTSRMRAAGDRVTGRFLRRR